MHIGGYGKFEHYFKKLSNKYNNIIYYGKLSYEKTLCLEKECDIMLAIYDPKIENHYYAAPNKFYESLMLGKPLIMVENTGMSEYIKKFKIGELIEFSPDSFKLGIDRLVSREKEWPHISDSMRQIYQEEFRWEVMENRLSKLYEKIFQN